MIYLFTLSLALLAQIATADDFAKGSIYLTALKPGALGIKNEITLTSAKARAFTNSTIASTRFVISDNPENMNEGKTYELEFQAPRETKLNIQAYDHVPAIGFTNPIYAAMTTPGDCANSGGGFEVLEFQTKKAVAPKPERVTEDEAEANAEEFEVPTQVTKLAINFIRSCDGAPTVAGAVRYNSDIPVTKPIALKPAASRALPKYIAKVRMHGDDEDYIGAGDNELSTEDARLTATIKDGVLQLAYDNGDSWGLEFAPTGGLRVGQFKNAVRLLESEDDGTNRMSVSSPGRGCNELTGEFEIKELQTNPDQSEINKFNLNFVQHCEGGKPALRGSIVLQPRPN